MLRAIVFQPIEHHYLVITHNCPWQWVPERGLCSRRPRARSRIGPAPADIDFSQQAACGLAMRCSCPATAETTRRSLPLRKTLLVPQKRIEAVYFIESGWVSMVAHLDEGAQAEVGLVGFEGMIGLPLVVGVDTAFTDTYMQASGAGLQMEATAFQRELEDNPALHKLLLRYSEAMYAQAMQTAACNGRHNLEQRLARWLLMAHDRSEGDVLPLTQEFLSLMLCVYRPSITVVARVLQKAGIISYGNSSKGSIIILDREALEDTACDCYKIVQERFKALLG